MIVVYSFTSQAAVESLLGARHQANCWGGRVTPYPHFLQRVAPAGRGPGLSPKQPSHASPGLLFSQAPGHILPRACLSLNVFQLECRADSVYYIFIQASISSWCVYIQQIQIYTHTDTYGSCDFKRLLVRWRMQIRPNHLIAKPKVHPVAA